MEATPPSRIYTRRISQSQPYQVRKHTEAVAKAYLYIIMELAQRGIGWTFFKGKHLLGKNATAFCIVA